MKNWWLGVIIAGAIVLGLIFSYFSMLPVQEMIAGEGALAAIGGILNLNWLFYDVIPVVEQAYCGDGIVEGPEECDEGSFCSFADTILLDGCTDNFECLDDDCDPRDLKKCVDGTKCNSKEECKDKIPDSNCGFRNKGDIKSCTKDCKFWKCEQDSECKDTYGECYKCFDGYDFCQEGRDQLIRILPEEQKGFNTKIGNSNKDYYKDITMSCVVPEDWECSLSSGGVKSSELVFKKVRYNQEATINIDILSGEVGDMGSVKTVYDTYKWDGKQYVLVETSDAIQRFKVHEKGECVKKCDGKVCKKEPLFCCSDGECNQQGCCQHIKTASQLTNFLNKGSKKKQHLIQFYKYQSRQYNRPSPP